MIRRIAEIEKIDELEAQEFMNEKKYPCAVGSFRSEIQKSRFELQNKFRTLRQSHKFIAEQELERLDNLKKSVVINES